MIPHHLRSTLFPYTTLFRSNITGNYYPLAVGANAARHTEGWILTICTAVMIVLALIILGAAIQKWVSVMSGDRKSTRLNSSHGYTSYAVFCLIKKRGRTLTT